MAKGYFDHPIEHRLNAKGIRTKVKKPKPWEIFQEVPAEGKYNGWSNWDTWNLYLMLDNDQKTYNYKRAWLINFARKMKKGNFDTQKAKMAIYKYIIPMVQKEEKRILGSDYNPGENAIDKQKVNLDEVLYHMENEAEELSDEDIKIRRA